MPFHFSVSLTINFSIIILNLIQSVITISHQSEHQLAVLSKRVAHLHIVQATQEPFKLIVPHLDLLNDHPQKFTQGGRDLLSFQMQHQDKKVIRIEPSSILNHLSDEFSYVVQSVQKFVVLIHLLSDHLEVHLFGVGCHWLVGMHRARLYLSA